MLNSDTAYWRHRDDYDLGVLNGVSFWRNEGADLEQLIRQRMQNSRSFSRLMSISGHSPTTP